MWRKQDWPGNQPVSANSEEIMDNPKAHQVCFPVLLIWGLMDSTTQIRSPLKWTL